MYDLIGLLKLLIKPINYPVTLVLFLNTSLGAVSTLMLGGKMDWMSWCISIAILLVSILLVTMKWFNKLLFLLMRKEGPYAAVSETKYHERLTPIFADAVQRARSVTPNIRTDIELYIVENEEPIIKSSGSNIIYATTGAIEILDDEELGSFFARECGHIGNRDFEITVLLLVSGIPNIIALLIWKITDLFCKAIPRITGDGVGVLAGMAMRILSFIGFIPFFLWILFIYLLNVYSLRQKELSADAFSVCLGYAAAMESGLPKLYGKQPSLLYRLLGFMPSVEKRMQNIQNIVNATPVAN